MKSTSNYENVIDQLQYTGPQVQAQEISNSTGNTKEFFNQQDGVSLEQSSVARR